MAQQTLVRLVDDLDGKELKPGAGETVSFSLDGVAYEIDLGAKNASALRKAFAPYIQAGRRVGGAARRARGAARSTPWRYHPSGPGPDQGHSRMGEEQWAQRFRARPHQCRGRVGVRGRALTSIQAGGGAELLDTAAPLMRQPI